MQVSEVKQLARLLAAARRKKGFSLRMLGELSGVSYAWIRRLELGEFRDPSSASLARVANALDVPLERIERITRGQFSSGLPSMQVYLRAKYLLKPHEIQQVEAVVDAIRRERAAREAPAWEDDTTDTAEKDVPPTR